MDKYRAIALMKDGPRVRAMIGNLLGETTEEEALLAATHVAAERFDARGAAPPAGLSAEAHAAWLRVWEQMGPIHTLHGFPLWEREVPQRSSSVALPRLIFALLTRADRI